MAMTTWIYESPDGGKTVTRREFGNAGLEKDYLFRVNVGPQNTREEIWTPKNTVNEIIENSYYEALVREKYPAVREAWEHYQSLLQICIQQEKGV
jgi:hypothetical protein